MNNRSTFYFIYPRDKKGNRTHTICVMAFDGKVFHGISTCSQEDQFNKKVGRELAFKRAVESVDKYKVKKGIV